MDPVPFRFTRESRIRIDREGHVWHEGERVENPRLARALASWVDWDPATARWVLRHELDWCFVTVDHTPFVVRAVKFVEGDPPRLEVERSDGLRETLDLDTVFVDPEGPVYAYLRGARLLGRFDRASAFAFLEHVDFGPAGGVELVAGGRRFPLHTLDAGAVPPYVRPESVGG